MECDEIVRHFSTNLPKNRDVRQEESVSRTNYFDYEGRAKGTYDWIYARILKFARENMSGDSFNWGFDVSQVSDPGEFGRKHVDFILMHEFKGKDYFDWHVDTKPGDDTGRTVNVNIMLSSREDYNGGELSVGTDKLDTLDKGDLYWYPAAFPHKVMDIEDGLRHTLIIAVKTSEQARYEWDYWSQVEQNFISIRALQPEVSKWHWLHGEHLAAMGQLESADECFAKSYASTPQAAAYATKFDEDGQRLVSYGRLEESLGFFRIAVLIEPTNELFVSHFNAVKQALASQLPP